MLQIESIQILNENVRITNGLGTNQNIDCHLKRTQICSDGLGGAFIVWGDDRDDYCDIYGQRVNSSGDLQWVNNGLAICSAENAQFEPQLVCNDFGSAIVAWFDNRDSNSWHIYAQKVDFIGNLQWGSDGAPVCVISGYKMELKICGDSSGGAIIAWVDNRSINSGIYAQKINSDGDLQWLTNGVPISTGTNYMGEIQICSDGDDGAMITWQDDRNGNLDIYAQRINSSGSVLWPYNGIAICNEIEDQAIPKMCRDNMNGVIISWVDQRSGPYRRLYAQRISSSGNVQWTINGERVIIAGDRKQQICSDGFNGAIIVCHGGGGDIYAQRINSSGDGQWNYDGIAICTANGEQDMVQINNCGVGNAIITWLDQRNKTALFEVYAQRINVTGNVKWMPNGMLICSEDVSQIEPRVCCDETNGAIISWIDERYFDTQSIYAQRINSTGDVQWITNGIPIRIEVTGATGFVSGYNLLLVFGILSVGTFLFSKKIKKM